jgi:hypothetical protein
VAARAVGADTWSISTTTEKDEILFFCPRCAAREFGLRSRCSLTRSLALLL